MLGRHQTCSKERIKILSDAIERHHPLRYTPSLLYPEGYSDGERRNHVRKSIYESPRPVPKISFAEGSQPTQPNLNPIHRTGRPVETELTSRSSAQEIDTRFSLDCENTTLFVERLEKDKDTDKDVDADRDRTERPVGGHWSPQLEVIDIDFNVSGLPHAVWSKPKILVFVNSWRRSRVILIDKIFKPICNKVMPTTHLVKNQRRWFGTWAM